MGWVVNATPRPLYPRERPGTHCIGSWVGPRTGLDRCGKFRLPPGFNPRTVQSVASHYTDWAVTAPKRAHKVTRNVEMLRATSVCAATTEQVQNIRRSSDCGWICATLLRAGGPAEVTVHLALTQYYNEFGTQIILFGMWWHTVTHGRGSEGETGEWSG